MQHSTSLKESSVTVESPSRRSTSDPNSLFARLQAARRLNPTSVSSRDESCCRRHQTTTQSTAIDRILQARSAPAVTVRSPDTLYLRTLERRAAALQTQNPYIPSKPSSNSIPYHVAVANALLPQHLDDFAQRRASAIQRQPAQFSGTSCHVRRKEIPGG